MIPPIKSTGEPNRPELVGCPEAQAGVSSGSKADRLCVLVGVMAGNKRVIEGNGASVVVAVGVPVTTVPVGERVTPGDKVTWGLTVMVGAGEVLTCVGSGYGVFWEEDPGSGVSVLKGPG
jgi:hypothetical protein